MSLVGIDGRALNMGMKGAIEVEAMRQAQVATEGTLLKARRRYYEMKAEFDRGKRKLMELDQQRETIVLGLTRMEGALTMLGELGAATIEQNPGAQQADRPEQA